MKKTVLAIVFMTLFPSAYSAEKSDIIAGPETDSCWRTNADRGKASECLHALSDKSNKRWQRSYEGIYKMQKGATSV